MHYPRSRRIASWCYQQLNRLLFRLDVRDTQVGLKVFNRRVVDEVVPLLLVKQFAFDLELLAVARALGYNRVQELPVRLEYRFTGSALGSTHRAARALGHGGRLLPTACAAHLPAQAPAARHAPATCAERFPSSASVGDHGAAATLDYPELELAPSAHDRHAASWWRCSAPEPGRPVTGSPRHPVLRRRRASRLSSPRRSHRLRASLRKRVAAAVLESRLGGGSRRSSFFPGNVRTVVDHPAESIVVRRRDYLDALAAGVDSEELVVWLRRKRKRTIYTPDTSLAAVPAPLVRRTSTDVLRHARARGLAARRLARS